MSRTMLHDFKATSKQIVFCKFISVSPGPPYKKSNYLETAVLKRPDVGVLVQNPS